ncbi:hypothetical protein M408DRAFT_77372 [Serendipita vermifera MAFF 305830]|uniref:Mur ligase central domain-containing protein n=1 Tax=Serendipita vermifera MAFF 305830 TaxID=933852 RepID=A0A0C3AG22_SERVB|nr:hypothetical protein M408DRAFT_77372 [Serendipita vermifera MAFF 305830]
MTTIDLSLERISRLVARFPPYTRPTVHVTGTNGKGSVTSLVASILRESGMKVGKFNSPHLLHPRDAIEIGGSPVSLAQYDEVYKRIQRTNNDTFKDASGHSNTQDAIAASQFEVLTVTALRIFEEEQVDMAVVEVGMGGRLDATNILPPENVVKVSAMTMVDLDHTRWLGSTISAIAREKAGIARRNTPFVIGPQKPERMEDVEQSVREAVRNVGTVTRPGARVLPLPNDRALGQEDSIVLDLALRGSHQVDNLSTALAIVECLQEQQDATSPYQITTESITRGVSNARWPGRLEFVEYTSPKGPCTILLDGAHNASSATALRTYIDTIRPNDPLTTGNGGTQIRYPVSFVMALSDSPPKTPTDTLEPLLQPGDHVAAVEFSSVEDMPWVRPVNLHEICNAVEPLIGDTGKIWKDESDGEAKTTPSSSLNHLEDALHWAIEHANGGLVVVAGSLYLVADFYRLMGTYPQKFKRL